MAGEAPARQKRRADCLDGNPACDISAAESVKQATGGIIRIPRHIKEGDKSTHNNPGQLTTSGLFGNLAATTGGSSGNTFGALLGAAQGNSIFAARPAKEESDDEDEHSLKRLRRPTEFDFEAARRQREEEEEEAKQKEAEKKEEVSTSGGQTESSAPAPDQQEKVETADAQSGGVVTAGPVSPDLKVNDSTTKSIFGPGLFGCAPTTGQSLFTQAPVIKPLEAVTPAADPNLGIGDDISVDSKQKRPTTFPGETEEDVVLEDFDTSLSVVVKNDAGQWAVKKIGAGVIRLLKDKSDASIRCVFRLQGVWRLELNAPMSSFTMMDCPKPNVAKFMAYDMRKEGEPPEKQRSVFIVSFPSAERKNALSAIINQ